MEYVKGRAYVFVHRRKGRFIAEYLGSEPGDHEDPAFLLVRINTCATSGQSRLANSFERGPKGAKQPASYTTKLLRPSLLESVERLDPKGTD